MEKTYKIQLRLSVAATISPLFAAVQGDKDARKIEATILNDDGTVPFSNETGITAEYWSRKPDGNGTEHSGTVTSSSSAFKVDITLTEQDLAVAGRVYATIVLKKSGAILSAVPFWFTVLPIPTGDHIDSTSDYQLINEAVAAANTAASTANTAAENADTKAGLANTAAGAANTAATNANDKAALANTAAGTANTAASNANDKASLANTAAGTANTAAENANTKAGLANTAAGSANDAATAANAAANKANTAATHGPYIDSNTLYWYVWDETTQQYVNTYVVASGAADGAVLYNQQTLTEAQKTQARTNIAAQKELGLYIDADSDICQS